MSDDCPNCGEHGDSITRAALDSGAWEVPCPGCGVMLAVTEHDNGWQASMTFALAEPEPEGA